MVREKKTRTNKIVGFVTVPALKKIKRDISSLDNSKRVMNNFDLAYIQGVHCHMKKPDKFASRAGVVSGTKDHMNGA